MARDMTVVMRDEVGARLAEADAKVAADQARYDAAFVALATAKVDLEEARFIRSKYRAWSDSLVVVP